ncbi:cytochrome P450 [Kitasatospora sp. NPDC058218]|uniref:cytochrome P450 family protein n=1 Tax=Kitasatospora sp. NPDC058218 TaxID=3346385 RepID=UPI0036DB988A
MTPDEIGCPVLDMAARAPHRQNARLRSAGPAVRVELPGGIIAWSVTRTEVIRALAGDPRVSRDPRKHWPGLADVPEGWPLAPLALQQTFFNLYGSEHRAARRRMTPSFAPRRVSALRPGIEATAAGLVGAIGRLGPGEAVDIRRALSLPLTMTVVCDLFGVPAAMRLPLGKAMDTLLITASTPEQMQSAQLEINALLTRLLHLKRSEPGPDLASDVAAVSTGGDAEPTEEQSRDTLFMMIGAGYETAVNLITSAVQALLTHPRYLALVRDGDLGWEDVIEETLRHEGPVMHLPLRYPLEDIELGEGVVIRRGEPILLAFGAAGRDPEVHPDRPDDFDPTRPVKDHLAFGHGPHFCLGAPLARLEAEVALAGFFSAHPDAVLAPDGPPPVRLRSAVVNGPAELWVVPTPASTTGM